MAKEFIIGREASSAIPVPADRTAVSGTHVKISIADNGQWHIEDCGSSNGTFVRDSDGNFQKVFKKVIDENTVIRLGRQGHNSFSFMAHRVLEPTSYTYEFHQLKRILNDQIEEEEKLEKRNRRNMNIVKTASPAAMMLCMGLQYIVPSLKNDPSANLWISRIAMAVAPFAIGLFFARDSTGVKALKQRRMKLLTCPKCGFPIAEFDIHNMQCSRCKAK